MTLNALAAAGPLPDDVTLAPTAPAELQVLSALRSRYATGSYSGNTWAAYETDLRIFGAWCEVQRLPVFEVTRQDVERWMRDAAAAGYRPATIARRLAAIHEFYLEAQDAGYVTRVPTLRVRRPRVEQDQKLGIGLEEARRVLATAQERDAAALRGGAGDPAGPQSEPLLLLLMLNGLRATEATSLLVESIDTEGGYRIVRFVGKGGTQRKEALAEPTAAALDRLIAFRGGAPRTPLFVTGTGKQMTRHDLRRFTRALGRAAGVRNLNPHENRHTFVTLMLEAGVPLHRAQEAAAHVDPRTTFGYNRARIRLAQHPTHELARHILGEEDSPDPG